LLKREKLLGKNFISMNKKLISSFALFLLAMPTLSLAVQFSPTTPPGLPLSVSDFWIVMVKILNLIWPVFIGLAIIMFLVSAFMFLTSQGEPSKLRAARDSMIWGVVGVVVGIVSVSLPFIIGTTLGL